MVLEKVWLGTKCGKPNFSLMQDHQSQNGNGRSRKETQSNYQSRPLVGLGVAVLLSQQAILEATHGVVESEVATTSAPRAAPVPEDKAEDGHDREDDGQDRVSGDGLADIEEELLDERDGELGLDGVVAVDDLVEGLGDGSAADHDVVAGDGGVPVSSVL